MKGIMALLEDNYDYKVPSNLCSMANMYPNTSEEQSFFYSILTNNTINTSAQEVSNEEPLWDGLWNLDDVHGNFGAASTTTKSTLHNLVTPFC